jgi:hypothetical protein
VASTFSWYINGEKEVIKNRTAEQIVGILLILLKVKSLSHDSTVPNPNVLKKKKYAKKKLSYILSMMNSYYIYLQ